MSSQKFVLVASASKTVGTEALLARASLNAGYWFRPCLRLPPDPTILCNLRMFPTTSRLLYATSDVVLPRGGGASSTSSRIEGNSRAISTRGKLGWSRCRAQVGVRRAARLACPPGSMGGVNLGRVSRMRRLGSTYPGPNRDRSISPGILR